MKKTQKQVSQDQQSTYKKSKPIQKYKPTTKPLEVSKNNASTISLIQQQKPKPTTRQFVYMPNVQFYLNKMTFNPNGNFIDVIHKHWWGNYIELQTNHNYIQWLFPNSFQSRFNQSAKPLTKQQAKHFRQNLNIARRYVHSYEMILEFFGMKLRNRITGEVCRTIVPRFKDRYDQTLLSAYHNHLRVTRILCSLTQVGFSYYARQWCKFLKRQIYEHNGKLIRLKHLDVYKHWRPYEGDSKDRSNNVDIQDVPNIYLRQLWKQQSYKPLVKQRSKWSEVYHKNKPTITLQSDSDDDEKVQTKGIPALNQQDKHQQKRQTQQVKKQNPRTNNQKKQQEKIKKYSNQKHKNTYQTIEDSQTLDQNSKANLNDQFEQFSSSDQNLYDEIEDKQYGRRGSKQLQLLRKQLSLNSDQIQRNRLMRQIRKQQEHERKLQLHIKEQLRSDHDNPIKTQMNQLRQKYHQTLDQFRKKGTRRAQTIQQRERRRMNLSNDDDDEF